MRDLRKPPAPWLFSLLILPLGIVVVGFNFTAFPLLLAQAGVQVDRIASISSIIKLPGVIGFLIAPVVDIKFRLRTWLVRKKIGVRLGNWLTAEQSQKLSQAPNGKRLKEKRDRALLAVRVWHATP